MNDDVVADILARSDAKDVLRCKSVCKSWYSLISSPYFVKSHLLKHKSYCNTRIDNNDVGNIRIAMPRYWKITNDDADVYQSNVWDLVGSSNGLVCVSLLLHDVRDGDDYPILIINPRTREVRELPLPTMPPREDIYGISLSFGYDSSTDDYKLVMGINESSVDRSLVHVFSLKSMTWKLIGHINYLLNYSQSGVLLNGAFHWIAYDLNIENLVILSFDLSSAEFKSIPVPVPDDSRYVIPFSTLGIFQDNLCMSCVDENDFFYGLWVMRDNNSWELLLNDYEFKSPDAAIYYMKIYDCTSLTEKRMGFFCDDKACFTGSQLIHTIKAPLYVQSLVSPYLNTEMPSHPGSVKVAERERQEMRRYEHLRNTKSEHCQENLRRIVELYKLEGGENEKSYLREDGETNMNKKKSRAVNMFKIENSASGKKLLSTEEDDLSGKISVKKCKRKFMQSDVEVIDAPQSAVVSREVTIDLAKERGERGKRGAYTCAGNEGSYQKSGGQGQGQSVFVTVSGEYNDFDNLRADLEGLLGGCGEILRLSIPKDYDSGFPKGIAFIDFADNKGFIKALQLSGTEVGGGCISVTEAKSRGSEAFGSEKVKGLSGGDRKGKSAMSFEDAEMDVDDYAEPASNKKRKKSNSKSTEHEANVIADEKSKKKSKSKSNKHEALDGDAEEPKPEKKKKRKRSIEEEAQPINNVADDGREKKKKKKRSKGVELEDLPAVSEGKKKKKKSAE